MKVNVAAEPLFSERIRVVPSERDAYALCVPMYSIGGKGVISVVSGPAPTRTAALYRDYRAGRFEAAAQGQVALHGLIKALFSEPNPQPCKMAMHLLGVMAPATRLPLLTCSETVKVRLRGEMQRLGLLAE